MQNGSGVGCARAGPALVRYVCGELNLDQAAEIESHLSVCPACRAREAFERRLHERLQELWAADVPPRLRIRVKGILSDAPTG